MQSYEGQAVDAVAFIQQLDPTLEFPIPTTGKCKITTKNSEYIYDADAGTLSGGSCMRLLGKETTPFTPWGSSFGGSMLKQNHVVIGGYLEGGVPGGQSLITSKIQAFEILD